MTEEAPTAVIPFPCRHKSTRQRRTDGSLLPCAWPGCSEGLPAEVKLYKDRINPPFTLTFERRVTGGGVTPLFFLWRVMAPNMAPGS